MVKDYKALNKYMLFNYLSLRSRRENDGGNYLECEKIKRKEEIKGNRSFW
jgi:hypothetical protein